MRRYFMKKSKEQDIQLETPIAAAICAGLPIEKPQGSFLVDIGEETTCAAVISLGGIVRKQCVSVGAAHMEPSIRQQQQLDAILQCVRGVLSDTPPELCADIYDYGMYISGSGALLKDIAKYFSQETGLQTHICYRQRVI